MEVNHLKQYLPDEFEGGYKQNRRYIHAVICVYLLTIIQPEYKKITYHEFISNFEKYVQKVNFEDNPCLLYQSGKNKGKLKIPNENTFVHKWIGCYNVPELIEDFKTEVAGHIAKTTLREVILNTPDFIEKDTETFNKAHIKQQRLLDDTLEDGKQPYQVKAYQETKSSALTNINDAVGRITDFKEALYQESNQSEKYNPNHDRIIDKYHNLENEWEED